MIYKTLTLLLLLRGTFTERQTLGSGQDGNLRVCFVEGKGLYKKAGRFCPVLEKSGAGIECVIGTDRLDCLRRISKGTVDFGVFSSEDLLAARWAKVEVLITDELRYHLDPFEYEVVAIVDDRSQIDGLESLRGSRLCHPGYGNDAGWTDTIANFFESRIIPKSCNPSLSLMESRLRDSSFFFSSACKAGPWVPDRQRDQVLKSLYPNLCASCYDERSCSTADKYWGRRGPLHCLTEESGDVAWARLDDTRLHFGLVNVTPTADPTNYSYLCTNGTRFPVKSTKNPCIWIAKPWPIVAAKRKSAAAVSALVSTLNHDSRESWQSALLSLIEYYHTNIHSLQPQMTVEDYLEHAIRFQDANNFAECNPPRSISICTTNVATRNKCDWLAETTRAYGLEPQLQCVLQSPFKSCFHAINHNKAEIVIAHPDSLTTAKRDHNLEPILYENTLIMNDLNIIVAVVNNNSSIKTFNDLRGKKACFPKYEGVAWNSVMYFLKSQNYFKEGSCEDNMCQFFSAIYAPGMEKHKKCVTLDFGNYDEDRREINSLKCIIDNKADVAFIGLRTLKNNTDMIGVELLQHMFNADNYRVLCPSNNKKNCYISWSTIGHIYTRANSTNTRKQEMINIFKQLDLLFGKNFKSNTNAFTMYGPFDHKHNVLFQDRTKFLRTFNELSESRLQFNYEIMVRERRLEECEYNAGSIYTFNYLCFILLLLFQIYLCI